MKLLILGGTIFVGRHIVASALKAGHSVTTLNRGTYKLEEQKDVERLIADRSADLHLLKNRKWDAVIDTCGYVPGVVSKSVEALKGAVDNYIFISTVSVYKGFPAEEMDETAPIKSIDHGDEVEYGSLKAGCEKAVVNVFQSQSTIVRPGLVVGPHDPTDRFTYWPVRVSKGGRVLAPGDPERRIQFIDGRDLGDFTVHLAERKTKGVFNAIGPAAPLTMRQFLNECNSVGGNCAQLAWMDDQALIKAGVSPWRELPLWIPASDRDSVGFLSLDNTKAKQAGLKFTPLSNTIKDTLTWISTCAASEDRKAGMKAEKENNLLQQIQVRADV